MVLGAGGIRHEVLLRLGVLLDKKGPCIFHGIDLLIERLWTQIWGMTNLPAVPAVDRTTGLTYGSTVAITLGAS